MNAIPLQTQLDTLDKRLELASKKKVPDKEWLNVFHEVCGTFRSASAEERIDILVGFEDRHRLLNQFTAYLTKMAQTAAKTAQQGNQTKAAALIEEGVLADAIIDGRVNLDDLHRAQNLLVDAAEKIRFDLKHFIRQFETPVNLYVERAYYLHKEQEYRKAIQVLGRAIRLDPALQKNEKIAQLAAELTGESPRNALMTIEDSFLRNRFLEDWEDPRERALRKVVVFRGRRRRRPSVFQTIIGPVALRLVLFYVLAYGWANLNVFHMRDFVVGVIEYKSFKPLAVWMLLLGGGIFVVAGITIAARQRYEALYTTIYRGRYSSYSHEQTFNLQLYGADAIALGLMWVSMGLVGAFVGALGTHIIVLDNLSLPAFNPGRGVFLLLGMVLLTYLSFPPIKIRDVEHKAPSW